jgi:hypothetical protein
MTEDLITDLSKISGLMVIARNSTFTYKGKPVKIKQVAEELGVRYVLEGSVRKAGDEIRINAQLIDAMTGHHLWAERYDGTMSKVFALQDPITQKIVSAPTLAGPNSDRGESRIEGDMICHQFQKSYWGLEFCGTVFRNPKGTNESKDEYFFCNDIGFTPFSLVR